MKAQFISDLHLCESRPETIRAFFAYLELIAPRAQRLYILGDLFEYWAGDDDDTPLTNAVAERLAALAAGGTEISFIHGNRDFLLGERYAARCRMQLLNDPTVLEFGGQRIMISHGDALCTDDTAYQAFRTQVRNAAWQRGFLDKPLAERKQIIEMLRMRSEVEKSGKQAEIMDVNPGSVADLLRAQGFPLLIHGHTHRPGQHLHAVDGRHCARWVLSDWHADAPYLVWEDGALHARRFRPDEVPQADSQAGSAP